MEESSSAGTSLFQLIIALIMLGIGHSYSDDCNNGATDFLVIGGWISFAFNILPLIFTIVKYYGLVKKESCVCIRMSANSATLDIQMFHPLLTFVVLIWVAQMIIL